jgi:hypothetical protein
VKIGRRLSLIVLVLATLLSSHPAAAQLLQQRAKLVTPGGVIYDWQGHSVSISADGNTAIIGGRTPFIWSRSGRVWTRQWPMLIGSGAVGNAEQGWAVALSADGNTAVVGGPGDGATWIWTRNGGVWTQQGPKLRVFSGTGVYRNGQGRAVALSADGNTVLVGGDGDNNGAGAAWVWTRSGGVWTQQGAKLFGSSTLGSPYARSYEGYQGTSVALSADGNTAIIGGPGDGPLGAAWIWSRSGSTWTEQQKLTDPVSEFSYLPVSGSSVALSADGNMAVIGAPWNIDNGDPPAPIAAGAAFVWIRRGTVWIEQPPLVGSDGEHAGQGMSVAVSADGTTVLVGAPFDGPGGAAWIFEAAGGGVPPRRRGVRH